MRDISHKVTTLREATARAEIRVSASSIQAMRDGTVPKGDPLPVAKVAAIQAAKNTPLIIPYCHPVPVEFVGVHFDVGETSITIDVTVKSVYKTGVEMEALTGATAAALNIYDILKMIDESLEIVGVRLLEKKGGKSDYHKTARGSIRAAVLVSSDSVAAGKKRDISGVMVRERLEEAGIVVEQYDILPDEPEQLAAKLKQYADDLKLDLVVTSGGTGFGPRDHMPEVMREVVEFPAPGVSEAMRAYGQQRTPYSMLSRGASGIRGRTLIINLPGSKGGVSDSLNAIMPYIRHAFKMLRGEGHPEDQGRDVKG